MNVAECISQFVSYFVAHSVLAISIFLHLSVVIPNLEACNASLSGWMTSFHLSPTIPPFTKTSFTLTGLL